MPSPWTELELSGWKGTSYILDAVLGGTGLTTPFVVGDIMYADTTTTWGRRAIGSTGQVLSVIAGVPTWTSPWEEAVATSDTTWNNSTVFGNAAGLSVTVVANAIYEIDGIVWFSTSAGADIKFQVTGPGVTTVYYTVIPFNAAGAAGSVAALLYSAFSTSFVIAGAVGGLGQFTVRMTVVTGPAGAGTVQIQAAQNTAEVSNTMVLMGSYLRFKRVA